MILSDGHGTGWRVVPSHDPVVKDAADHAVKTIQQRSNSLAAYELLEIVHAKAEVGLPASLSSLYSFKLFVYIVCRTNLVLLWPIKIKS